MLVRRWTVLIGALVAIIVVSLRLAGGGSSHPVLAAHASAARPDRLVVTVAPWHLGVPVSRAVVVPATNGDIWVLGGLHTGDTSTADVWLVDPRTGTIRPASPLQLAVHDAGGASLVGRAYVFAGGSATTVATVQSFANGSSTEIGSLPGPRSDLVGATINGAMYIAGGFDGSQLPTSILSTVDGVHFRSVGTLVQPVRYPAAAVLGAKLWLVGGELSTTEGTLAGPQTADIQVFDPSTGTTTLVGHLPHAIGHAMAVALGGSLYVFGGRVGSALSPDIWKIDPKTGHATDIGRFAFPRSDAGVVVVGAIAYLIGGESSGPAAPLASIVEIRLVKA